MSMALLLLAVALAPGAADEGCTFGPLTAGDVSAVLTVRVAGRPVEPGRARVLLSVTVTGPADLEVKPPLRLDDSLAAWKVRWAGSGWSRRGDRIAWEQAVEIVQTKAGAVNLPAVRVPYSTARGTQEPFYWDDLLREPRDMPDVEDPPPLPPSRWLTLARRAALGLLALALPATLALIARRLLRRPVAPLTPHERALRRLASSALPSPGDPGAYHDRLAAVLRDYLAERFSLSPARTTGELLAAAEQAGVSPEARTLLAEVLAACDLVKFAGARPREEASSATAERARSVVHATRPVEKDGERGRDGQISEADRAG
jgi:hypothetical protein